MSKHATFPAAAHVIIRDEAGRILFQRRQGTKLYNGWLGLPAGHVDEGEHPHETAVREIHEELGLTIDMGDCAREMHATRRYPDGKVYFDAYYDFEQEYTGMPEIVEKDKCSELVWLDEEGLPADVIPYERIALQKLKEEGCFFSIDLPADESETPPC